ncbi:hypothetical protein Ahy_A02g008122 [Arachis hypogaea]|uniref:Transposase MuDR plant domain-containing protein n=1 Tax=Arachis hypogaea TaxID=3818 RepID=A0A445EED2_ARAHY|nr:hypothetical protein Ahy_A02g008122 [Arachis hypogaea]
MRAVCKDENCGWLVYAANNTENNYWQIKTFNDDHSCARETKNRLANRKWLARKLVKKLRKYPNLRHCEAAQYFKTKCDLELSKTLTSDSSLPSFQEIFIFHSSLSFEGLVLPSHVTVSSSRILSTQRNNPHHLLPFGQLTNALPRLDSVADHRSTSLDPHAHHSGRRAYLFLFILLMMLPNDLGMLELPAA